MKNKANSVTVNKVVGNFGKAFAVFGGMFAGKLLSNALDKIITSPTVSGLVGVSVSSDIARYVKPLIVVGSGVTTYIKSKDENLKFVGLGAAGLGVNELVNAFTGKSALSGVGDVQEIVSPVMYEEPGIIEEFTMPEAPSTLNLPELKGMGSDESLQYDNYYEEPVEEVSIDNIELI